MTHYTALNENHKLGKAKEIRSKKDLVTHLVLDHGVSAREDMTKGHLGKIHLLAHTVHGFPEIRELMGLPANWGS